MSPSEQMPDAQPQAEARTVISAEQVWLECPLPYLLDTSVLFSELLGLAKKGRSPRLLAAAQSGAAILYVPTNVAEEIPGKFGSIASAGRVSVEAVAVAWWDHYSPYVRVIDAVPAEADERRQALAADDADDLPFADAVAMMGPVLAFSEDTDLTLRGLASDRWRDLPELTHKLLGVDLTFRITPELTAVLVGETAKAARRFPKLAAFLLLLGAYAFGPFGPERVRLSAHRTKGIGLHLLRGLVYLLQTRSEASEQIAARLVSGGGNNALRVVVAALARRGEPVAEEVLAEQLSHSVDATQLQLILSGCPAVIETPEGWQLGRNVSDYRQPQGTADLSNE